MTPEDYMHRAIQIAHKGEGHVSPNPLVGCVIVKDGRIISEAAHEQVGQFHAERNALLRCREDPAGADLYVTLEPCCHYGRTPPCTDIILEKKIRRVFVGALDVNPLVAGKGVKILRDAGVEVYTGICEKECRQLAEVFFHYMTTRTPFVVMKYAMSLDGKIACASGDSRWITGEDARRYVHELRRQYTGIMVGIGTVIADDPMLNCRIEEGVDPIRIVCDSHLRLPQESRLVQTAQDIPVLDVCTKDILQTEEGKLRRARLEQAGVKIIAVGSLPGRQTDAEQPDAETEGGKSHAGNAASAGKEPSFPVQSSRIDLQQLMHVLGEQHQIDSILLEGGGTLNASALEAGIVQKVVALIGSKLIGGAAAKSPVEGTGAMRMADAPVLTDMEVRQFGADVCISGYLPIRKAQ